MAGGGGGYMEMAEQRVMEATCGDLFEHLDEYLLDFPKVEDAADVLLLDAPPPGSPLNSARIITTSPSPDAAAPMEPLPLTHRDVFLNADSHTSAPVFDATHNDHIASCDELDMAQLEWLSNLFDDTSIPHDPSCPNLTTAPAVNNSSPNAATTTTGVVMATPSKQAEEPLFRSSSPISVLEHNSFNIIVNTNNTSASSSSSATSSSESFSGGSRASSAPISPGPPPAALVIPGRARSKRSRPSAFSTARAPLATAPLANPAADAIAVPRPPMHSSSSSHSDPESIAESSPYPPLPMKKKKAKKPSYSASVAAVDADEDYEDASAGGRRGQQQQGAAVRRCMHCQIEKTPQWRAGPMGPKTLCNACGVRYKSGRLFPEYRPAASPTFVPAVHSNSHKKVVEMRLKAATSADPSCDLLQYIRRRD